MSNSPTVDSNTEVKDDNPGCNEADQQQSIDLKRSMKRARTGCTSSDNNDDSEPDEKRPTFRLQPPTLIHGKAKPVPKQADGEDNTTSKCKFLQPSKLSVPSSSTAAAVAVEPAPAPTEPVRIGRPVVSRSNPFLLMAEKENNEENSEVQVQNNNNQESGFVFGSNLEGRAKVNGAKETSLPDSTTDTDVTDKETDGGEKQNLFLSSSDGANSSETTPGGFVFGSKMEDRAMVNAETIPDEHESGDNASSVSSSSFVFGQNLAERAKVSPKSSGNEPVSFMPQPAVAEADSSTGTKDSVEKSGASSSSGGLEESAAAHFAASQNRTIMPEVEVVTGEEDEKNVLQMQCKLYQFEAVSQNWLERGVGILHLNDGNCSDDDLHFPSRLVMRTHGSLRLVLNTKIWAQMTVDKASKKSVRVSAQTGDGKIGVFLITAAINDAEQIYRALEYRILHQKQLEDKRKALKESLEPKDSDVAPSAPTTCDNDSNSESKEKPTEDKTLPECKSASVCNSQSTTATVNELKDQIDAPPSEGANDVTEKSKTTTEDQTSDVTT
uniref:Ran-binding protein 3 n=1 Tax=Phallusia mammillata TaxID=59560 RepID=A0A6F9DPR0_9ASCI|nr:ran-binding protein 3 [Phallusia mammillata]